MNKELEEAIKYSKEIIEMRNEYGSALYHKNKSLEEILETLVQAVENSIPTSVVEEKILELNAKYPKGSTNDFTETERDHKVSVLQELLQEKGE